MLGRTVCSIAALVFGLIATSSAWAGMVGLQTSVKVDHTAGNVNFTIDFPHPPDFSTLDSSGRPADSFGVEIAADPTGPNPLDFDKLTTIVRGDEIHFADTLIVRNAAPPVSDMNAGGWGSVRGTAPFTITGDALTFTAPLSLVGAPNGRFAYRAFTEQFGVAKAESHGVSVPLPSAFAASLSLLALAALFALGRSVAGVRARQ